MNQSLFHHSNNRNIALNVERLCKLNKAKKGLFLGCSAYPECDYLRPLQRAEHKSIKNA